MILAGLEDRSEHPVARAIVSAAKTRNITGLPVDAFQSVTGQGVSAKLSDVTHLSGSAKMMAGLWHSPDVDTLAHRAAEGKTPVYVATQHELLGVGRRRDQSELPRGCGLLEAPGTQSGDALGR